MQLVPPFPFECGCGHLLPVPHSAMCTCSGELLHATPSPSLVAAVADHSHSLNSSLPSFLVCRNATGLNAPNLDSGVLSHTCDHRTLRSRGHSLPIPPPRKIAIPLCAVLGRHNRARSHSQLSRSSDLLHSRQGDLCGRGCFYLDCFSFLCSGCGDSLFPAPSFRLLR
jgi:hypothetical protein